MEVSRQDLEARYRELDDDDLVRRYSSGTLTDLAQSVARDEMRRRKLPVPRIEPTATAQYGFEAPTAGDLVAVAQFYTPTEAYILAGRLTAEGIPAFVADVHATQAQPHLAIVTGGVRVLVHEAESDRALHIVDAFNRGEFDIAEGEDPESR